MLRAKAVLRWCAGDACRESCGEKVLLLLVVLKTRILFGAAKTGKGRGAMMQTRALAANYGVQSANNGRKDVWELMGYHNVQRIQSDLHGGCERSKIECESLQGAAMRVGWEMWEQVQRAAVRSGGGVWAVKQPGRRKKQRAKRFKRKVWQTLSSKRQKSAGHRAEDGKRGEGVRCWNQNPLENGASLRRRGAGWRWG